MLSVVSSLGSGKEVVAGKGAKEVAVARVQVPRLG